MEDTPVSANTADMGLTKFKEGLRPALAREKYNVHPVLLAGITVKIMHGVLYHGQSDGATKAQNR